MKTIVPLAASLLLVLAALPLASAQGSVSICDRTQPDAVHRGECAVYDTAQGIIVVAQPTINYVDGELIYYDGVICAVVDHEIGGHPCYSTTYPILAA